MFRRLFTKLALVLAALYVVIGGMFAALIYYSSDLYHQELHQKLYRSLAAQIVEREDLFNGGEPDAARLESLFNAMESVNPGVDVYLLDAGGTILAHSVPKASVEVARLDTGPIRRMLAGDPLPLPGEDPGRPGRRVIFSASSVTEAGERRGYLYLVLTGARFDAAADSLRQSHAQTLGIWTAGSSLAFAVITALILSSMLTRRLHRLADAAERFRTSNRGRCESNSAESVS